MRREGRGGSAGETWGLARVLRPACSSGRGGGECSGEGSGFELRLELSPPVRGDVEGEVAAAGGGGEGGPGSSASSSSSSLYMENSAAMPSVSDAMARRRERKEGAEFGGGSKALGRGEEEGEILLQRVCRN